MNRPPHVPLPALFLCLLTALCGAAGCRDEPRPPEKNTASARFPPAAPAARDTGTIILAADVWPPYNCALEDTNEGYMVDVAREIFEPLGYRVEYRIVPWKRALAGTQAGTYDGAIAASRVEGPGLVFPRQELVRNRVSFFTRADDPWRFQGEASLAGVRLGAAHGYDYVGWLNDYIALNADRAGRVQIITGNDPMGQNLRKLISGRIDVMAGNQGAVLYTAMQMGLMDRIRLAGQDSVDSYCYIGFSPSTGNGRLLAEHCDRGLGRLRASGRLAEILRRYAMVDWAPPKER